MFLVVGPSGAGKDSIIDGARTALAGDHRFHFVQRVITRPAHAGGEQHRAVTAAAFSALADADTFALSWHSHGLRYGVPVGELLPLARGCHCIANVSRTIVPWARRRRGPVVTILITASEETLRQRLLARGRETADDVAARVRRATMAVDALAPTHVIRNDGALSTAVDTFTDILQATHDD